MSLLAELLTQRVAERLEKLAEENAEKYQNNTPFPHIVIDNFLPEELVQPVLDAFPDPEKLKWIKFNNPDEKKLAFNSVEKLPDVPRDMLLFLNSSPVLQFLERMTGISSLVGDPYYVGGGLHQIERGGKLEVHADFNTHEQLNLDRRLNLLLYLNKDWEEDFGGHLQLWNLEMTHAEKKVLPLFNRCVVFSTTSTSWHGHPEALTCPEGRTRKSLATYYYTNGRPEEEKGASHSTLFARRPGVDYSEQTKSNGGARELAKKLLPPIVVDAARSLRK
jgi:Rps23 Pro-64 3,4-dihydroxylase Tpa1-like proline 4-hydroxylase